MPTLNENLENLFDELRLSRIANEALAALVNQVLAAKATQAQVAIDQFVYRAPSIDIFVDPASGDDNNDGFTLAKAKKTIDAALSILRIDTPANINLFGDVVLRRRYPVYNSLSITGLDVGGGVLGAPYRYVTRNVTFASEALNSPNPGYGRVLPGLFFLGPYLQLRSLNITMPDATSAIDTPIVVINSGGGQVTIVDCTIAAATAVSKASLLSSTSIKFVTTFAGVIGQYGAGKIFYQIGAGQNPNTSIYYDTNLTAA